tara:strand:+ start:446 stop:1207 length:762 start_codon:yes stop_codon:yes gene_type:complete
MSKNFSLKHPFVYMFKNSSKKSEVVSQILYGEKFKILSKQKKWIKIKTSFDKYVGYIKNEYYSEYYNPTHKIFKLKTKIYKKKVNKKIYETKFFLPFGSKISIIKKNKNFIEYEKNKWIKKKDIKQIKHKEKNYLKIFKIFLKTKYIWGGKSFNGIDCSALLQLFFFYNGIFYPRDTKDQIKFLKDNIKRKIFKRGDIIFWKGHVAICINNKQLIHAFGPRKKVVIMNIKKTILEIKNNSKINVIVKKNINDY